MKNLTKKIIFPGLLIHVGFILLIGFFKVLENNINSKIDKKINETNEFGLKSRKLIQECLELSMFENKYIYNHTRAINIKGKKILFDFENTFLEIKNYLNRNKTIDSRKIEYLFRKKTSISYEILFQHIDDKVIDNRFLNLSDSIGNSVINESQILLQKIEDKNSIETSKLNSTKKIITIGLYISLAIAFILLFAVFFILQSFIKNNDKALDDLNKNRSLLKGIIDNTPTPISVKNLNGKYIYANKKFSDLFEINKIEVIGKTDLELFKKDVADQIREKDIEIIKNKSSLKFEEKVKHKDEIISYINTKFPIMDDQGDISAIGTISTDISEKNKLDLELFNNEKKLNLYFQNCPAAIIVSDESSKIISVNDMALQLTNFSKNEIVGQSLSIIITNKVIWEKYQKQKNKFSDYEEKSNKENSIEIVLVKKGGEEITVDLYEKVFKIGDHPFFISVFHDISNKKKSEIQKENTIVFLNSVIENLPNMVFIKDAEKLSFIKINKAGERLLGISRADLLGKTDFDFFPKKQAEYFVENDKNVIKNKTTLDIAEELIETKFGSRWLHTKKIALSNNNHTPQYLLGISEDITDKKIIEKERDNALIQLKESESKLELVISNIGEGVIMTNEVQELLLYNQTATEIFETLEPKKLASWTFKFHIFYPDGNQIYPAQMLPLERALRGQPTDDVELVIKEIENHSARLIKVNGRPIQNEEGKIIAAVATIKDITQQKEIEKKLEESEQKYRQIIGFKTGTGENQKNNK